jgi:bifunctional DNase/RNase
MNLLEAKVEGLALDMTTNSPVVILAPLSISKVLPIWIGHAEAWSIAMELSGMKPQRPMTYDLLVTVLDNLDGKIERVEITELREQTFYARILLSNHQQDYAIDARPSDSIAVALKTGAPIYVNEELFNLKSSGSSTEAPPMPTDPESLSERLKKINPEDFGKYSL